VILTLIFHSNHMQASDEAKTLVPGSKVILTLIFHSNHMQASDEAKTLVPGSKVILTLIFHSNHMQASDEAKTLVPGSKVMDPKELPFPVDVTTDVPAPFLFTDFLAEHAEVRYARTHARTPPSPLARACPDP
jgi:hypothetical protein